MRATKKSSISSTRIYGRASCETVHDPVTKEIIVKVDDIITEKPRPKPSAKIGVEQLKIRSVLTCESKRGCCIEVLRPHLGTRRAVKIGEAVGIVAAQSIGEPGTQLTMRTFHVGGVAGGVVQAADHQVKNSGTRPLQRHARRADRRWQLDRAQQERHLQCP